MKYAILLAALLTGCAPIAPLQLGPYWFKSGAPSTLPEYVEYSRRAPAECSPDRGVNAAGMSCGAAVRNGQNVHLLWIDSSYPRDVQNCLLNHERAHKAGWFHAQRGPVGSGELCGYDVFDGGAK